MTPEIKGIHIQTILNYLASEIERDNSVLQDCNLYEEQTPFDRGAMFLRLAFLSDESIIKIVDKIHG